MTVINVTDATLKGDVAGPTFTGKVDGSRFTGAVTYTDSTAPPIDPPPEQCGGPTGGLITKFNNKPNDDVTIDNVTYEVDTDANSYALQKLDDYTLRYEIRQGDKCDYIGDSNSVNRAEIGSNIRLNNNTVWKAAWRILLEPGEANGAEWFVTGQMFDHDHVSGVSPPFCVLLVGEKFQIEYRYCRAGGNPQNGSPDLRIEHPWTQPSNLVRNQWYVFEVEAKMNQSSGYLKVKLDGLEIVNYAGPLGYGGHLAWSQGLYRAARNETFVARIKNMTIS